MAGPGTDVIASLGAVVVALLPILAPVFAIAGLGFLWIRFGLRFDTQPVTDLVSRIGAPCLIFTTLVTLESSAALAIDVALAAVFMILGAMLIGAVVLPAAGLPRRAYLAPLMFANSGNLGISICLFAFAAPGLELAIVYFTVTATLHFTLGVLIWSGKANPAALLRTPFPYAVGAGLVTLATDAAVPDWLLTTTSLLGGIAIPLMLFTLGATVANCRLVHASRTVPATAMKFAIGLLLAFAAVDILALDGVARGVVLLQAVMPTPVFAVLFAQHYQCRPDEVASLVVATTVASLVLIPVMLAYLLLP